MANLNLYVWPERDTNQQGMRYVYSFDYRSENNGFEGLQLTLMAALNWQYYREILIEMELP